MRRELEKRLRRKYKPSLQERLEEAIRGFLEQVGKRKRRMACFYCGSPLIKEDLGAIFYWRGRVEYVCDSSLCVSQIPSGVGKVIFEDIRNDDRR